MKKYRAFALGALLMMSALMPAWAGNDVFRQTLKEQENKAVTVLLTSGTELTGKVGKVEGDSVKLTQLSGKEFFDAVISLDQIQAVLVRAR